MTKRDSDLNKAISSQDIAGGVNMILDVGDNSKDALTCGRIESANKLTQNVQRKTKYPNLIDLLKNNEK